MSTTWQPERYEHTLTMPISTALTAGEPAINGFVPVALWSPTAWTAAAISFLVSRDGGATYADAFDDLGLEIVVPSTSIPTAAARRFALNPRLFLGITNIRLRSGLTGAAVNQAAERSLILVTRPIS
jgi:hypothetical protein